MTPNATPGDDPGGFKTGGEINAAAGAEEIREELRETREELREVRDELLNTREELREMRDSEREAAGDPDVGGFDVGREP